MALFNLVFIIGDRYHCYCFLRLCFFFHFSLFIMDVEMRCFMVSLGGIEFEATCWIIGLDKYWISILLLILYNYDLLEIFKDLVF